MSNTDTTSFGFREVPREEKQGLVRGVFDRSARRYDLMNDVMSLGIHRVWKDITITRARPKPGERLIDVAGGTGDLARAFIERSRRPGEKPATAIVADINEEMLRAGIKRGQADGIEWAVANAECLPFDDRSADCVMIGFGIRNVTERMQALREMHRVLKPGGRFLCLEFSRPVTRAVANIYDLWSFKAIPELGALIAKDRDSYQYLVESIRRFPHQEAFAAELREAGFGEVKVTNLSGGIAALHTGWRTS
ncbi:ubiquinone/menaquinone biosynthesis methyltransferase [Glycocaulis alkaliphilus]|uniref:Ubiquinone/menaquinone biosynthesis C-methyltransferase UbiE n=1 Tax=Glycocaulis alkaliphilus TaxID=1434191 RepID=A0A3T0E7A7_9PROT|nr:class I SAM-dependent methyltransferase [Glycocaulis alkaliphilus]AZU03154.1 ubiquinone/menaquinone biosynthesis methyltransferase [Glycocaulis alkaliphilus]GGB71401.1 ubiquinone/menaquinone biosynthesis C-methyltransferase UbiE [Glycocaulis alkaliphilus]